MTISDSLGLALERVQRPREPIRARVLANHGNAVEIRDGRIMADDTSKPGPRCWVDVTDWPIRRIYLELLGYTQDQLPLP